MKPIIDTLVKSIWILEQIFGYEGKDLIFYDTEREESKNFLKNLGYEDVESLFPPRPDEEKLFRTLWHLFNHNEYQHAQQPSQPPTTK